MKSSKRDRIAIHFPLVLAAIGLPSFLVACGGGGGSSSSVAQGLEPPAELNLVEPVEPTVGMDPAVGNLDFAADSDYETDTAFVNVYDPAIEPLTTVNQILCFIGLAGANLLVNEGNYLAQIDPTLCEEGSDQASLGSEDGQSTGSTEYELWTVNATRASGSAPQINSLWVPGDSQNGGPEEEIRVSMRIDEGASTDNPFGSFEMDFAGVDAASPDVLNPLFIGTLETVDTAGTELGFSFFDDSGDVDAVQNPGDYSRRTQVQVRAAADQSSGYARIISTDRFHDGVSDSGKLTSEYLVAFDDTHFLRSIDGGTEMLYSRDQFDERVWQYNLYYASGLNAGDRVERDSGFGFRTDSGAYGYAGYYGVWVPDGVTVDTGDVVLRDVYDEPSEQVPYTVTKGGGKLVKLTRQDLPLDDVLNDTFQWWEFDNMTMMSQQYLISWDGADWVRTATVDMNTFEVESIEPPTVIDTVSLGYLGMYSDSLGGPASWTVDEPLVVTYFAQDFENADSDIFLMGDDVQFYGLVSCLDSGLTGTEVEAGDIFLDDAPDVMTPYSYVFQKSDLTLYHDVNGDGMTLNKVGLATGEAPTQGPYTWGMQSGPLVMDLTGLTNVWDVWTLDEFWQYETGQNDWNVLWSLSDSLGNVVDFDPPLQFSYTHATANDRNGDATYDGKTYFFNYDGPGQLYGLPTIGADLDGDMQDDRYYPVFSIADGVAMGETGVEYVVKAIEVEQVLTLDPGGNPSLDLTEASDLVLPDGTSYNTPLIGDKPAVTDAPRIINGELVGTL